MTIEEARALIPPGWVECDEMVYKRAAVDDRSRLFIGPCVSGPIYAIPAPKPEPRRVPIGEMVVQFSSDGYGSMPGVTETMGYIRNACGTHGAVANTKWKLDPDAREWVEVME